jgi:hypothetical protein
MRWTWRHAQSVEPFQLRVLVACNYSAPLRADAREIPSYEMRLIMRLEKPVFSNTSNAALHTP